MAKKRILIILCMIGFAFLAIGCDGSVSIEPKVIDPSLDDCPICRMSIIDLRFAGQVINNMGQHESFDDIGCLILYLKRLGSDGQQSLKAVYVKDFASTQWIPAKDAVYVQGRIDTPMSFGIVAFTTEEKAEEMAEKIDGQIISWEEVKEVKFDIGFDSEADRGRREGEINR